MARLRRGVGITCLPSLSMYGLACAVFEGAHPRFRRTPGSLMTRAGAFLAFCCCSRVLYSASIALAFSMDLCALTRSLSSDGLRFLQQLLALLVMLGHVPDMSYDQWLDEEIA